MELDSHSRLQEMVCVVLAYAIRSCEKESLTSEASPKLGHATEQ